MSKAEVKFPAAGGGGTPYALDILDEGNLILSNPGDINFAGAGVTVTESPTGTALVTIPGATATAWGTITGTLSNQTDLQNALNTKFTNGGNSFGAAATIGTNDNFGLNLETNGVTRVAIDTSGRVAIGTGQQSNISLNVEGNIRASNYVYAANLAAGLIANSSGAAGFSFPGGGNSGVVSHRSNPFDGTSGTGNFLTINIGFNPTSGTLVYNSLSINPTINQTGGANGISRGILIQPTLTAAADYRAFEALLSRVNANDTLIKLSNSSRDVFKITGDDKIGLYTAAPVAQATTLIAASVFIANTGNNVKDDSTFDGYTVSQVVKALRDIGLLA
jgi:hypothetical protein